MTKNQIDAKRADIEERQHQEARRSNRAKEKLQEQERLSKESIAIQDRRSRKDIADADRQQKYIDTASRTITSGLGSLGGFAKAINDPSWYNLDPSLVRDAGSISYGAALGSRAHITEMTNDNGTITVTSAGDPGIMVLRYAPTIGSYGVPSSNNVINVCARNVYSFVRHANSGSANYEAVDLALYLTAMESMISYIAYMTRVYSIALTAKGQNRAYPLAMLQALNVSPSIIGELANFREFINYFIVRVNSFYIPKDLPIYQRRFWMNANIFKDAPIKKSELYMFKQGFYHKFAVNSTTFKGELVPYKHAHYDAQNDTAEMTCSDFRAMGENLLSALVLDEDINVMSGDILKAYGEGGVHFINSVPIDYHVEEVYSPDILMQITNARVCDITNTGITQFTISQDANGNMYQGQPLVTGGSSYSIAVTPGVAYEYDTSQTPYYVTLYPWEKHEIIAYKDDVTELDNFEFTRLTPQLMYTEQQVEGSTTRRVSWWVEACGTELIYDAGIILVSPTYPTGHYISGLYEGLRMDFYSTLTSASDVRFRSKLYELLFLYQRFDWAPKIWLWSEFMKTGTTYKRMVALKTGDLANFAEISKVTLKALHEVAILSLYGVPLLGRKVRTR